MSELTEQEREALRQSGHTDGCACGDGVECKVTLDTFAAVERIVAAREAALAEQIAQAIEALRPDAAMASPVSYRKGRDDAARIAREIGGGDRG